MTAEPVPVCRPVKGVEDMGGGEKMGRRKVGLYLLC